MEKTEELLKEMTEVTTKMRGFMERSDKDSGMVKGMVEKCQTRLDEIEDIAKKAADSQKDELERLETMFKRTPSGNDKGDQTPDEEIKSKAFSNYLRKGEQGMTPDEVKALSTDSDPDGGFAMPLNRSGRFIEELIEFSPIRSLATIETISTGDSLEIDADDAANQFASGWLAERETPAETATGKLRMETIPTHFQYAEPRATQKALDDPARSLEQWLNRKLAQKFGVDEGREFVSGTGVGRPQGLLDAGAGVAEIDSGDASLLTPEGLLEIYYALPGIYASRGTWVMRRATIKAIRLFKDTTNQFIWQPGLQGGQPQTILNQPVVEALDMPAVASNAKAIVFGDIRAAYTIVDRQGIMVLRDPFTSKPFVKFFTTRRVGGQVVLKEAIRIQKVAA